jgi:LAO/AO transport system kinase
VSAQTGDGIAELWERVEAHRAALETTGALGRLRSEQAVRWLWRTVESELVARLRAHPEVRRVSGSLEREVRDNVVPVTAAAARLLDAFRMT